jgi:hypothetical protein
LEVSKPRIRRNLREGIKSVLRLGGRIKGSSKKINEKSTRASKIQLALWNSREFAAVKWTTLFCYRLKNKKASLIKASFQKYYSV